MKRDKSKDRPTAKKFYQIELLLLQDKTFMYLVQCNFLDALFEYGFHLRKQTCAAHRCLEIPHGTHCRQGGERLNRIPDTYTLWSPLQQPSFQHTFFPSYRTSAHTNLLKNQIKIKSLL